MLTCFLAGRRMKNLEFGSSPCKDTVRIASLEQLTVWILIME